jgi:hypothetical protein
VNALIAKQFPQPLQRRILVSRLPDQDIQSLALALARLPDYVRREPVTLE